MIKKLKRTDFKKLSKRQSMLVLAVFIVIGAGAIAWAALSIINTPRKSNSSSGFPAYIEHDTSLGIDKVVSKDDVVTVLGGNAKSVDKADVSSVFNWNGDRGQTLTYNFVRADGNQASVYVDVTNFKDEDSMKADQIYTETAKTSSVSGHPIYLMHAQTIGMYREYRIMVVNGLKAYKFVMDQPYNNITIGEVSADAMLIKLARKAQL